MHVCSPIFFPSFLIMKMHSLWFFLHLSMSGAVNNIKIICSIRFSLLITIDRFYKLFLTEGAFVNGVLETIFFALFHPASTLSGSLCSPPSPRGEGFISSLFFLHVSYIRFDDAGIAASSYRSLPHWVGFAWGTVFSFLHSSHAKTAVSYERPFLCVLLA